MVVQITVHSMIPGSSIPKIDHSIMVAPVGQCTVSTARQGWKARKWAVYHKQSRNASSLAPRCGALIISSQYGTSQLTKLINIPESYCPPPTTNIVYRGSSKPFWGGNGDSERWGLQDHTARKRPELGFEARNACSPRSVWS